MKQAPPRHCWRSCAPWCRGQTLPVLAAPTSTAGLSPCRVTKPEGFCSWGAHQTLVSVLPGGSSSCRSCSGSRQGAGVHPSHMGEGRGLFSVTLHLQLPPREVAMEQALWSPLVTRTMPPGGKGVPRTALPHKDHLWLGKAAESSESSRQTESLGRLSCSSLYAAVSAAKDFFF